jgi:hypothetical protein
LSNFLTIRPFNGSPALYVKALAYVKKPQLWRGLATSFPFWLLAITGSESHKVRESHLIITFTQWGQDKRGFRKIQFSGHSEHLLLCQPCPIQKHCQWVSAKNMISKNINDTKVVKTNLPVLHTSLASKEENLTCHETGKSYPTNH